MGDVGELLRQEAEKRAEPARQWSGFPLWHALLVHPGREMRSADWLIDNAGVTIYLPLYLKQVRLRCGRRIALQYPVVPGLLFAPIAVIDIPRRGEAFDCARVHGFLLSDGKPASIPEAEIGKLRQMEALLNEAPMLPPACDDLKVGERVALRDPLYASWGQGEVMRVDASGRIDVRFDRLLGRATKITVPAASLERM